MKKKVIKKKKVVKKKLAKKKKRHICIACQDTGKNSRGAKCRVCKESR